MKLRIYSLMVALFLIGVICGVALSVGFAKRQIRSITGQSTAEVSSLIVKFLDRRLDLSPEQEFAVQEVLSESEKKVLPLRREFRKRALNIIQTQKPLVSEHLDSSQKEELDKIVTGLLNTWMLGQDPDINENN